MNDHHLKHMIVGDFIISKIDNMCLLIWSEKSLHLILRNHQTNPNWGAFYKKNVLFKFWKKERLRNFWIKGDKRGQLNAICDNGIRSQTRGLKRHFFFSRKKTNFLIVINVLVFKKYTRKFLVAKVHHDYKLILKY